MDQKIHEIQTIAYNGLLRDVTRPDAERVVALTEALQDIYFLCQRERGKRARQERGLAEIAQLSQEMGLYD